MVEPPVPLPILVMARSLRLLAAIPLLSLMVMPALASGRYQVKPRDSFYSIARKCQVDVYELMRLNPRPDNALKLGEQLLLPGSVQCGEGTGSAVAAATDPTYQVQSRDSFYSVARKCRVNVDELLRLNPRPGNALKLGEQLRLPGNAQCGNRTDPAGVVARNSTYQVQPREGFYSIARKCQVDAKDLIRLNSASGAGLRPGQRLTLPSHARCPVQSPTVASASTPRSATTGTAAATSTTATPTQATARGTFSYQVQQGEGFWSIARKCRVDTRELINLNPESPSVLDPGQQLTLPGYARCPDRSAMVASTSAGTDTSTGTGANRSTTPAQTAANARPYYEVQPREGFYSIARKCQVNAKALMTLNPRPGNVLHAGDQLQLPRGAKCESVLAANPTAAGASAAASVANRGSGWRSYGPLSVNWQDWQMIEGHWVAQSLNGSDQPLYLAINCPAQRINQTNGSGKWSTWESPDPGFEKQIMDDLCQEKKALS